MTSLLEDLRLAARTLAKRPGFAAVVVASLGLAIGANAAVFSFVDAMLLRPVPVTAPERLVRIYSRLGSLEWASVSYPNYLDYQRSNRVFSTLAAECNRAFVVGDTASSQLVVGSLVSSNYFSTLGVRPALGRAFAPGGEPAAGTGAEVVIGDGLWKRHFAADPGVLGRALTLNGRPFRIIGVAPPGFAGPNVGLVAEIWAPLSMQAVAIPGSDLLHERDAAFLQLTGRLRAGVSLAQAREAMNGLAAQLRQLYPRENEGMSLTLLPEDTARIYPIYRGALVSLAVLLQVVVGLVLAVACANLAGLFLARGTARRREIGIRLALGATTPRLVRMLVSESLLLGLAGGGAGALLAVWAGRLLSAWRLPMEIPVAFAVDFDGRVLLFTLLTSLATGLLFGLVPALQIARPRLAAAIREGDTDGGPRRMRLRGTLVAVQIAFTFVLLVGAGLFFRSLRNSQAADLGFRADRLLVGSLNLGYAGYDGATGQRLIESLERRLRQLPGVSAVSLATRLPFGVIRPTLGAAPEGYSPRAGEGAPQVSVNYVAPDYFKTLDMALAAGREFDDTDRPATPPVVVVNEALARQDFPGGLALGRRLVVGSTPHVIVGIVRDSKQLSLTGPPEPYVYLDLFQHYQPAVSVHLRTAGDPMSLVPALRREIQTLDPRLVLFDLKPMVKQLDLPLLPGRMAGNLLAAMGALALTLALVGLYGATAYALSRRTRELGIRIALGASRPQLLRLVLRDGMIQCFLGVAAGLLVSLAGSRFAASLLYGVSSTDPAILAGTAALVAGMSLAANLIPAQAAIQVDPSRMLGVDR